MRSEPEGLIFLCTQTPRFAAVCKAGRQRSYLTRRLLPDAAAQVMQSLYHLLGSGDLCAREAGLMVVAAKMTAVLADGLCREMPWQAIRLRAVELRVRKLRTAKP